jgi:gliding motility-associated-like protein
MRNYACGGQPQLPNITFTVSSLSGTVLATANSGALPINPDGRVWKQYGLTFTTPPAVDAVVLTLSIAAQRGCGNAFIVDDITFSMCGPAVDASVGGQTDVRLCADYTNLVVLKGSFGSGFRDPVVQWQNSLDSGKTWVDLAGVTTLNYTMPHRNNGLVLYRMAVAERPNINSLHCRMVSGSVLTDVHPVLQHHPPQDISGCLNKDLHLPEADRLTIKNEWTGPNGYYSTDPKAVVSAIQYADTGVYRFKQLFNSGCTSLDTFNVKVYPSTTISTQTLYSICEGSAVQLNASGNGTFKWTPSTGISNDAIPNPVAYPRDSIFYQVLVTNAYGCKDSALVTINVLRNPVANAGPGKTIVIGDTVVLDGSVKGTGVTSYWSPSTFIDDYHSTTPKVYPDVNTQYTLTVSSTVGCGSSVSATTVKVYRDIFIPTAFTPNADGINDRFRIFAADGYKLNKFVVYNRWGQLVFKAKEISDSWDGNVNNSPQSTGSYVYYLEIETSQHKKIVKQGTITLVR